MSFGVADGVLLFVDGVVERMFRKLFAIDKWSSNYRQTSYCTVVKADSGPINFSCSAWLDRIVAGQSSGTENSNGLVHHSDIQTSAYTAIDSSPALQSCCRRLPSLPHLPTPALPASFNTAGTLSPTSVHLHHQSVPHSLHSDNYEHGLTACTSRSQEDS